MNVNEFISKLKHIASLPTRYYSVSGGDWAKWNGKSWNFDCVILIKAILWGWCEDKNHSHGGARYGSNGVYDDNADGLINRCNNVSTDFSKLEIGEVLWCPGHIGVYIGNNEVIECTAGWEAKVLYSKIDKKGSRVRNGIQLGYWKKHGKLPYINYACEILNTNAKYKIGDEVTINGIYLSSTSDTMLTPARSMGKITRIINGARNPYLLDNGSLGWINENCIVNTVNAYSKVYKTISNCSFLNLRLSPCYGNNIYTAAAKGTKVEYLGMENGWAKVVYNGKTLYCGSRYLS